MEPGDRDDALSTARAGQPAKTGRQKGSVEGRATASFTPPGQPLQPEPLAVIPLRRERYSKGRVAALPLSRESSHA